MSGPQPAPTSQQPSAIPSPAGRTATILVIDDLPANRTILTTLLGREGHRMIEAGNGSEGLAAVRAGHPDLVITDVLMPVMDGYEFVWQLRLDPATRGTPVIFLTAHYGEREARELALAGGVAWVLAKPTRPEKLLEIVGRVLAGEMEHRSEPGLVPMANFTREHLRLLTDKLSENTGDLKTANARLRALVNIGLELSAEHDPDLMLERVCIAARDLFGATYVTLGILDPRNGTVRSVLNCGVDGTGTVDAANWIAIGGPAPGILRTVMTERRASRGDNPGGDPAGLQLPPEHPEARAFLAVPVASVAHVYGWIFLVGNEGRRFTAEDEHLALALAGQVGRVYELDHEILERARAEAALRRERDRLQRFLDTAGVFRALQGGDLASVENLILARHGEDRLIEWRNTLLRSEAEDQ